jgi:excisionase family DNA binding protein
MKPVSLPRPALRKAQAARILGVCDPIVDRLIREKRLRAFYPTPGTVRILAEDLDRFIADNATCPAKDAYSVLAGLRAP